MDDLRISQFASNDLSHLTLCNEDCPGTTLNSSTRASSKEETKWSNEAKNLQFKWSSTNNWSKMFSPRTALFPGFSGSDPGVAAELHRPGQSEGEVVLMEALICLSNSLERRGTLPP